MAKGKALDYQAECRDLLVREAGGPGLLPYKGDGLDVSIQLGVPKFRFDVALCDPVGRLVVAECKRWRKQDRVEQGDVASFAYIVERLRAVSRVEVAAFYFTTSDYQLGALKTALEPGVTVTMFQAAQTRRGGLSYSFLQYDVAREARVKHAFAHITASIGARGTTSGVVIRGDGTREYLGELR
jgi:hypothetical protein